MKRTKKDRASNIAGLVMAIAGVIAAGGYSFLPLWLVQGAGLVAAIAGAYIGFLTGKDSEGKPKETRRYL